VLDQLSDTDTVADPKSTEKSSDVAGSIRHLPQTELEAYSSGRLPAARLSDCQAHLDSCDACRAELEDIRTFQSDLAGFQRPEPAYGRVPLRPRRRKSLALPLAVSVGTVSVVVISAALWWRHGKPVANKAAPAAPVVAQATAAAPAAPAPAAAAQTHDTHLANAIATPPHDVSRPEAHTAPHVSTNKPEVIGKFALLGPFGQTISETHPVFTWQPLPGAIGYTVEIVDVGLHPVQHSPALQATAWRPHRPLPPGHTYLWQVTATLHGGTKVVASEPSLTETALKIIPTKYLSEIVHFKQAHQEAHLALGALYAQAGMLTESADELRKVQPGDPLYNTARTMLKSLPSESLSVAPQQSQ
jgi:hypothetical protein